jgi:hypothetical protein
MEALPIGRDIAGEEVRRIDPARAHCGDALKGAAAAGEHRRDGKQRRDHAGQQPHRNIVHRLCGAGHETWGFGLAAGLARVVDVQRVLLLGSRDGV